MFLTKIARNIYINIYTQTDLICKYILENRDAIVVCFILCRCLGSVVKNQNQVAVKIVKL